MHVVDYVQYISSYRVFSTHKVYEENKSNVTKQNLESWKAANVEGKII